MLAEEVRTRRTNPPEAPPPRPSALRWTALGVVVGGLAVYLLLRA